jgi:uncharacterized protein YceK
VLLQVLLLLLGCAGIMLHTNPAGAAAALMNSSS